MIRFTGTLFKSLVPHVAAEEAAAYGVVSHASRFVEPLFSRFGQDRTANERICALLGRSAKRIGDASTRPLDFSASSGSGILILFYPGQVQMAEHLGTFRPYLATHGADDMVRLILRSFAGKHYGLLPFGFYDKELTFLDRSIPALVDAKIAAATREASGHIKFRIKILGVGREGGELPQLLDHLFENIFSRTDYHGAVSVHTVGFDISQEVFHDYYDYIRGGIWGQIHRTGLKERLRLSYDSYFGDIADRMVVSAMLTYGPPPDITLWRNTHLVRCQVISRARGRAIVKEIKNRSSRPGFFMINEDPFHSLRSPDLFAQEFVR